MSGPGPVGGDARGGTRGGWDRASRAVHLVGVGGAGMSGLARLLLARGHRVTGSDRSESATLEALRALGAEVWAGHDGARMGRPDLVVASTAIRATNPELVAARILDIPVLSFMEVSCSTALMMGESFGLVVPNDKFAAHYKEIVVRYGMRGRLTGIAVQLPTLVQTTVLASPTVGAQSLTLSQV